MPGRNEGESPMIEPTIETVVEGPHIIHQGRYRLYGKPDGGMHLVYQRDDSEEPDHMEMPAAVLKLAQMAGEGNLTLPELLRELMKLQRTM